MAWRRKAASTGKLRVAYFVDSMQVGGTELNAIRTLEQLDRGRFDLTVLHLHLDGPLFARYRHLGVPLHHIRVNSLLSPGLLRAVIQAARVLRAARVELLHAHDVYSNLLAVLAGRLAGVPTIVTSRRWQLSVPSRKLAVANAMAFRHSTRVLANSEAVRAVLQREDRVRPDRIAVFPNFVDDAAFEPYPPEARRQLLARLGVPANALLLGTVARLVPVKSQQTLLEAAELLIPAYPDLHVVLAGEGESRAGLEAFVAARRLGGRIHFAGQLPHLPNPHALFDISVLTSVSEGFPNAVVEAMAAGRPVVATAVGGTPEAVLEGKTGALVPPLDPAALAAALAPLLADPAARTRMGDAARALAAARYSARGVIGSLSDWYASFRGESPPASAAADPR